MMTVHPSGAITVDLAAHMLTPEGRKQLEDIRRLREFVAASNRCAGEIVNQHVLQHAAQASGGATK